MVSQSPFKSLSPTLSSSSSIPSPDRSPFIGGVNGGGGVVNYIQHTVTKLDTLAGVAIKYGVDVADIKRINGLVTDLQMFALKTLNIPLPGRHPPSPCLSNGFDSQGASTSEQTPPNRRLSNLFDSLESLKLKSSPPPRISKAMCSLQDYYGLKQTGSKAASEGFEMAVYRNKGSSFLEDETFLEHSPLYNPPLSHNRKSKSATNGFVLENGETTHNVLFADDGDSTSEKSIDRLIRRRQKSDADFSASTPETMLKEENNSGGGFSSITGKGLALRTKAANRTTSAADTEAGWQVTIPVGLGDSLLDADSSSAVRKSSSTSSLQDSDNGTSSSIWPSSKWTLKPDLTAFSNAAITIPMFDGLPKPLTGRRNKAALD